MKVLMINGSPNEKGCTYTALREVAGQLEEAGIETQMFHIGNKPIQGCINCGKCAATGYCIFNNDRLNECIDLLSAADGLVVGSPVYYAGPTGSICAFLDRLFFLKSHKYTFKPAAAVMNCRRGGASATFDRLNKYFTIANMPVVPSQYWNSTHGFTPQQVRKDKEGMQTMRTLGRNMAWMIKCFDLAKGKIPLPEQEKRISTHFIME